MKSRGSDLTDIDLAGIWDIIDRHPPGSTSDTAEMLEAMRDELPIGTLARLARFLQQAR